MKYAAGKYREKQYRKKNTIVRCCIQRTVGRIWTRKIRVPSFQATLRWKGLCSIIFEHGSTDAMCSMHTSGISTLFRLTNGELSSRPLHPAISYSHPFTAANATCGKSTHVPPRENNRRINKMLRWVCGNYNKNRYLLLIHLFPW